MRGACQQPDILYSVKSTIMAGLQQKHLDEVDRCALTSEFSTVFNLLKRRAMLHMFNMNIVRDLS